jgi:hypothetical protein
MDIKSKDSHGEKISSFQHYFNNTLSNSNATKLPTCDFMAAYFTEGGTMTYFELICPSYLRSFLEACEMTGQLTGFLLVFSFVVSICFHLLFSFVVVFINVFE